MNQPAPPFDHRAVHGRQHRQAGGFRHQPARARHTELRQCNDGAALVHQTAGGGYHDGVVARGVSRVERHHRVLHQLAGQIG